RPLPRRACLPLPTDSAAGAGARAGARANAAAAVGAAGCQRGRAGGGHMGAGAALGWLWHEPLVRARLRAGARHARRGEADATGAACLWAGAVRAAGPDTRALAGGGAAVRARRTR